MVALAAGLGYGFDAYAVNIYSLILPAIVLSLGLTTAFAGVIGSIFLIGYTLGTVGFGIAADRYGRKDTLGVSILLYGVTTALGGIGTSVVSFTVMRFLTGCGGAGELAVGAPYTCEMFRTKHRALGTGGIVFALYSLGYIVAGIVAILLLPSLGWHWPFIFAVVPAVGVFLFRRHVQESVLYVIQKADNKFAAAQEVLEAQKMNGDGRDRARAMEDLKRRVAEQSSNGAGGHNELAEILNAPVSGRVHGPRHVAGVAIVGLVGAAALLFGLLDTTLSKSIAAALVFGGALVILLALALYSFLERGGDRRRFLQLPIVRKRIGISWLVYSANAMGYWGISTFLTTFMVKKFHLSPTTAIWWAVAFYGMQFVFSFLGTWLSDRIGRRPAAILGCVIMIVCTLIGAETSSLPTFLVFGGIQVAMLGWLWGVSNTYVSELFPTSIRGACFGLGVGGGRVMSITAPFLVAAGIVAFGVSVPYALMAILWLFMIAGYLMGPETAAKPLEQIEAEFIAEARQTARLR